MQLLITSVCARVRAFFHIKCTNKRMPPIRCLHAAVACFLLLTCLLNLRHENLSVIKVLHNEGREN